MAQMQNEYASLPGHFTQFKDSDRRLREDPLASTTESVLLLGTATDGPVMQPVRVTPQTAAQIFGKMTHPNGVANGATLLQKFEEVWNAGCRDVRLMRVTGKPSALSLKGGSYTQVTEQIQQDQLGLSQGNDAVTFTLPHGGIDTSTVVVKANGIQLASTVYTVDGGVMADPTASPAVSEVKGTLSLDADVTDMKADITISYEYTYLDEEGNVQTAEVVDNSTDANGNPMIANGADKVFTLSKVPKSGLKLYADGAEVTDTTVYTVDAANKTVTVHNTVKIKLGQLLEASYSHDVTTVVNPTIELESFYGGNIYNELKAKVESENGIVTITITKPESKKALMSEPPMVFKSTDYPSFQLMVNAINTHPLNNQVVRASTKYPDRNTNTLEVKPETYFSGGDDELFISKEEMYKRLGGERDSEGYIVKQGAYQILENYQVDYVIPLGVYADDKLIGKYDNFAYQLALACGVMSLYGRVTHGFIATSSPQGTTLQEIEEHVQKLLENVPQTLYMRDRFGNEIKDGEGNRIDLGQFISILAGPDIVVGNTRLGAIATQGTAAYGGFVSQLPIRSAPTNKVIPNALGLRYEYSASQLDRLTKARMVTFRLKNNGGGVAVVDSMTYAHSGSDYTRQSTVRIVKAAVNTIKEVADPFIGEPNDTASRNALTAAISKRLDRMQENGELLGYDFQIVATPQMELIGEAQIELSLQAPNELRQLTTIVSLS